jgi:hypothetical protein
MKLYYIHNNFLSLIKLLLITSAEILLGNSKILLPYYSIYITASGFYANKITNWTILDTTFSCYIQQIQNNQIQHFCFITRFARRLLSVNLSSLKIIFFLNLSLL